MARSVYVYRPGHPAANERGFVDTRDLYDDPSPIALNAPIMIGRFYENQSIAWEYGDGKPVKVDVGSRARYNGFLKENGLTHAGDYTKAWKKAAEQRERVKKGEMPSKTRREAIARRMYEIDKP